MASHNLPLDGSVCKMKGLPFKCTVEDLIRFFHGFEVKPENVLLKRHPDGRPNGEAFVVFESPEEARRATQKDRETFGEKFGDRYVRVYPTLESDVSDMQSAVLQQTVVHQQGNHSHIHMDSVVKMKSLPFDATQLDIINFFAELRLKPNGVQLVVRSDNKPTGEAFVDFESHEEATKAIREKDHKVFHEKFGDRYVRLIQVSRKEMQATLALRFGGEGILKVKGIPFKASAGDVRKFFGGYKIKPDGVSFIMHADGRPTGMAFIEFETPQEAVRAMEKDRAKFGPEYGDRFCMLQLVGRHEMDKVALQRESDGVQHNQKMLMGQNGMSVLQAAALATQAALQNPALQPMLLNPAFLAQWQQAMPMNQLNLPGASAAQLASHMGQIPTSGPPPTLMDPSALAAATQFGSLGNTASGGMAGMQAGLQVLSLLQSQQPPQQQPPPPQQQQQQQGQQGGPTGPNGMGPQQHGNDTGTWIPGMDPNSNLQLFYQNGGGQGDQRSWGAESRRMSNEIGMGSWPDCRPHSNGTTNTVATTMAGSIEAPAEHGFAGI